MYGFKNTTINNTEFRFEVTYFDANLEEPDSDYGVHLCLISPNGTALEYYEMDTELEDPSYSGSEGVVFNYTIDLSGFEEGLWHYYFVTKDFSTGNKSIYPEKRYFVGPYTSERCFYLKDSYTNSSYYSWIADDISFYVDWWDMIDNTEPLNVSLCLLPANKTEGVGISKTIGIQKFNMQTVDSTPNYSNPVRYVKVLNFADLGYTSSEIGTFSYYFEAINNNSKIVAGICSKDQIFHDTVLLVRPIDKPFVKVDTLSSHPIESGSVVLQDAELRFILTYSDFSGKAPIELPEIVISGMGTVNTYQMKPFYNSTNGETFQYYCDISVDDLEVGNYKTEFIIKNEDGDVSVSQDSVDLSEFNVFLTIKDCFSSLTATLALFGIVPLAALIGAGFLVAAGSSYAYVALIAILATLTLGLYFTMEQLSDNKAALLGFSIGCLFILAALGFGPLLGGLNTRYSQYALYISNFVANFQLAGFIANSILISTFSIDYSYVMTSFLTFMVNIFTFIPILFGIFNLAYGLNVLLGRAPINWGANQIPLVSSKAEFSKGPSKTMKTVYEISVGFYAIALAVCAIIGFCIVFDIFK